jgi:cation transport ATPase
MTNNQEKSNDTLTLFIKFIKEYLPFILIIPAFLGGVWQIIELSSISISFIRFFSVTQLIADGLLIIVVFFPWIIGYFIFDSFYQQMKKDLEKEGKNKKNNIYLKIFMAVTLFIVIILLWYAVRFKPNVIFGYIIFIINTYLTISAILLIFTKTFFKLISKITKSKNATFRLLFILMITFFFHHFFFIPENLKNLKNIPNGSILYFNDKYIFLESNDKTIEVIKFDKLFKE